MHLKIVFSAHVIFDECSFPFKTSSSPAAPTNLLGETAIATPLDPLPTERPAERPSRSWAPSEAALQNIANRRTPDAPDADAHGKGAHDNDFSALTMQHRPSWRGDESADPLSLLPHESFVFAAAGDPVSHRDAMQRSDAAKWRAAEIAEYESHLKNQTFSGPVTLPPGFKPVPAAGVYKLKRDGRYKYRIVMRGYHMKQGRDFNETFAPVAHISTLRVLFALAAKFGWETKQGDVSTAFLASPMDTELYATLPPGFHSDPSTKPCAQDDAKTVHRVLKGVPGMPQGSFLWNKKSHKDFIDGGLTRSPNDFALYSMPNANFYLVAWVDDLFLFYAQDCTDRAKKLWKHLQSRMDLASWQETTDCLGCEVKRDLPNRTITINQSNSVRALIRKAGMEACAPADTPVTAGFVFSKEDCPSSI